MPNPCGGIDPNDVDSPRIRRLHEYWLSKAGTREMPSRSEIDPIEIPDLLPFLFLVDVTHDPLELRFRLVGTGLVGKAGRDPTGKPVADSHFGTDWGKALADYKYVIRHRAPHIAIGRFVDKDMLQLGVDRIYLPLSKDGRTIDIIMAYLHFKD